ncbi:MAG: glycosyltransferase [Muribaculaceae bacterium]|nr:glycosyltransferase [Muribaculaceae bacterium]
MPPHSSPLFSIIVPVYNRPDEVDELLESLEHQTDQDFEIILVEDGSTVDCKKACESRIDSLRLKYYYKSNEGRSIARNYGIERADGDFLIFVDSDCILPPDYISSLKKSLQENPTDCFGGPDSAHESFSDVQKAINFSMTSFLTTGGIRGGKKSLEKFTPRTFNMGFSREVYEKVGGFREMFSEDIDMSTRIKLGGYKICLYPEVKVFHKRRVDFKKFWHQVHTFGMSRITLQLLYPGSMKLVHWLPALFVIFGIGLCVASFFNKWFILPLIAYFVLLFLAALWKTKNLKIASLALPASLIQLGGYGTGFIRAYTWKILLRHGRNIEEEVIRRKGK